MVLYKKIQSDMYTAMKAGEKEKASTLRTVLAKLKDKQIDTRETLSEKDEIKVLQTLVKQRKESIDLYQKGGRSELAEAESFELEIINTYLPEMMNEDDVRKLIEEIIEETGKNDCSNSIIVDETINNISMTIILVIHRFCSASESITSK